MKVVGTGVEEAGEGKGGRGEGGRSILLEIG